MIQTVRTGQRRRGGIHGKFLRHDANLRIERFFPSQLLAGISTHAAEDRRHRALGPYSASLIGVAGSNAGKQVVVFDLVRVGARRRLT